jgi:hypothetical protein
MSDLQLMTDLYAAFERGDLDAIRPYLAPDFVLIQSGDLPWGGRYTGPDGFFDFIGKLLGILRPRSAQSSCTTPAKKYEPFSGLPSRPGEASRPLPAVSSLAGRSVSCSRWQQSGQWCGRDPGENGSSSNCRHGSPSPSVRARRSSGKASRRGRFIRISRTSPTIVRPRIGGVPEMAGRGQAAKGRFGKTRRSLSWAVVCAGVAYRGRGNG